MNIARTLIFGAVTAAAVLAPATQAAATPNCDGTAAFTHVGYQLNGGPETQTLAAFTGRIKPGDRITVTSQQRPECADMPHSIVFYGVARGVFDPAETQHIITATPVDGTDIVVPASTHDGQCQVQIDDVTGPALSIIDGTHRYNETAIGGTRNRLVREAAYTTNATCQPILPPTSAPITVTTTAPPTVDVPLSEAPTTTAPAPTPPAGPVPSTPVAVVGGDPVPLRRTLPVTGADTWQIVAWGIGAAIAGAVITIGANRCRNRDFTTNETEQP